MYFILELFIDLIDREKFTLNFKKWYYRSSWCSFLFRIVIH